MGAWGLSLFQSDLDFDLIGDLNIHLGLEDLEKADGKPKTKRLGPAQRRQKENAKMYEGPLPEGTKRTEFPETPKFDPKEISYSIHQKLCSNPERVRQYLDDGALVKGMRMYIDWISVAKARPLHDPYGPGYYICLLGACAMTLGAKIPDELRDAMRKRYDDASFMRDAVVQLKNAIDGYVDGVPWDFGSRSLQDTQTGGAVTAEEDLLFPGTGMINVRAPDHGRGREEMAAWASMVKQQVERMKKKPTPDQLVKCFKSLDVNPYLDDEAFSDEESDVFPGHVCGACCAKECENGEELLTCSKCKKRKYCSRKCQKDHCDSHKKICKVGQVEYPSDACGACGVTKRKDGAPMLECSTCKVRRYCSRQCRKNDAKAHKLVCKAP